MNEPGHERHQGPIRRTLMLLIRKPLPLPLPDVSEQVMPLVCDLQRTLPTSVSWPTLRIGALESQFWMHAAPRLGTGTLQSVTWPLLSRVALRCGGFARPGRPV